VGLAGPPLPRRQAAARRGRARRLSGAGHPLGCGASSAACTPPTPCCSGPSRPRSSWRRATTPRAVRSRRWCWRRRTPPTSSPPPGRPRSTPGATRWPRGWRAAAPGTPKRARSPPSCSRASRAGCCWPAPPATPAAAHGGRRAGRAAARPAPGRPAGRRGVRKLPRVSCLR
jgi:hypothetical protein